MLPSADKRFKDADFIFQQDLAPAHTAKSTKSWLNDHGVGVLVKRKMRNKRPKNADELKATVKETWASIPPQQCHKLINDATDQGCEPATPCIAVGDFEELMDIFKEDFIDWFGEVITSSPASPLVPSSSPVSPESPLVPSSSPASLKLPPSLPLPPLLKPASSSALSPLVPVSLSAHPQLAPSGHSDPLLDLQSPASPRPEDLLSPPQASESWTPPRSFDPSAPPWLLAPSSPPWPVIPLAPPGALVPPAPPWSVVDHPPPRGSTPLALLPLCPSGSVRLLLPSGSTFVLYRSCSAVAFRIPASTSVT